MSWCPDPSIAYRHPGQSPCTRLQSCTVPSWSRRGCWFSAKGQHQNWDWSHRVQTANRSPGLGGPQLPHGNMAVPPLLRAVGCDGNVQPFSSSSPALSSSSPFPGIPIPFSNSPVLQTEFSLSLQINLGSMKSHIPPKLPFNRTFLSFFAENYYSIRNRKNQYWRSLKGRAVRVIQNTQDEWVSKGRLKRTSCATSGMIRHLFLGFLLLLLAKWLIGRI